MNPRTLGFVCAIIIAVGSHFLLSDETIHPVAQEWMENPITAIDLNKSVIPDLTIMTVDGVEGREEEVIKLNSIIERLDGHDNEEISWPNIEDLEWLAEKKYICSIANKRCLRFILDKRKKLGAMNKKFSYLIFDYLSLDDRTQFYIPDSILLEINSDQLEVLSNLTAYEIIYDFAAGRLTEAHYKLSHLVSLDRKIVTQSNAILWRHQSLRNISKVVIPIIDYVAENQPAELLKIMQLFPTLTNTEVSKSDYYKRRFRHNIERTQLFLYESLEVNEIPYSTDLMFKPNQTINTVYFQYHSALLDIDSKKTDLLIKNKVLKELENQRIDSYKNTNIFIEMIKNVRNLKAQSALNFLYFDSLENYDDVIKLDTKLSLIRYKLAQLMAKDDQMVNPQGYLNPYNGAEPINVDGDLCYQMSELVCI